jgi:hypothetical protein
MRRTALLLVTLFCCSTTLLFAGNQSKSTNKHNATEMTGWLCNAKCVDQSSGKATCDTKCAESSGQIVFIDDTGKLFNISDQAQEKVRPMAGKHCMIKAKKDPTSGELDIQHMPELRGP